MRVPDPPPPRRPHQRYPLSFRQEAVRLVEAGEAQQAICERLGISASSLQAWLSRYGTGAYQQLKRRVISPALKRHVVEELLAGRLSYAEAQLKYGLRHRRTLRDWVAAHRALPILPTPPAADVAADVPAPPTGSPAELAAQLQQARWQVEALQTLIDQAEQTYRIQIRKKAGAKPSK